MGPLALFLCSPFWLFFSSLQQSIQISNRDGDWWPETIADLQLRGPLPQKAQKIGWLCGWKMGPILLPFAALYGAVHKEYGAQTVIKSMACFTLRGGSIL